MSDQKGPAQLLADEERLYWSNLQAGTIVQLSKQGGAPIVMAADQHLIRGLAQDGEFVFWTNQNRIMKTPKGGGDPVIVATSESRGRRGPAGIAVNDSHIFWSNYFQGDGTINRMAKTGGDVEVLATNQDGPTDLALDETHVYWTNHVGPNKTVMRAALDGDRPETLATGQNNPGAIACDPKAVYWGADDLMIWKKSARTAQIFVAGHRPAALALDRDRIFWTRQRLGADRVADHSQIFSISKEGSQPKLVHEAGGHFWGLAADGQFLYWTDWLRGTVSRIRKPK